MDDQVTKQDVRKFYDQIGWQKVSAGTYQNAQYEDLRLMLGRVRFNIQNILHIPKDINIEFVWIFLLLHSKKRGTLLEAATACLW
jgi:aspartyl-tRNA synthetase